MTSAHTGHIAGTLQTAVSADERQSLRLAQLERMRRELADIERRATEMRLHLEEFEQEIGPDAEKVTA